MTSTWVVWWLGRQRYWLIIPWTTVQILSLGYSLSLSLHTFPPPGSPVLLPPRNILVGGLARCFFDKFLCSVITEMHMQLRGRKQHSIEHKAEIARSCCGVNCTNHKKDGWKMLKDHMPLEITSEDDGSRLLKGWIGVSMVLNAVRVCAAPASCLVCFCLRLASYLAS